MKLMSAAASKYSSPMLRPPTIATRPSAIQVLLCIRRLRLKKRSSSSTPRAIVPSRARVGLNRRTSTSGWLSSAASTDSLPCTFMSSSSSRTRTPRSAACSSSWWIMLPVKSACQM